MQRSVRLDDSEYAQSIDREIEAIRGLLGRSSKLLDLFDYLVERSRNGAPPREIEIAQDVFGRITQSGDDGGARVYIHRLRKRLEEIYSDRADAELHLTLPLGEYRLIAETGMTDPLTPDGSPEPGAVRRHIPWRPLALGAVAGLVVALLAMLVVLPWQAVGTREAAQARGSDVWASLFANGRSVIVAEGDHYLFAENGEGGRLRLLRDYRIRSREELDSYLLSHPQDASRYVDVGQSYVPTTVPRAQQYLSPILVAAPSVRVLPASQVSAAALLSQNIVYLGLTSGLGPLRAPVASNSRFELGWDGDAIRDKRTGRNYDGGRVDGGSPRRQYGLVSLFSGKEGNRYIVLAATSEMGLVGLVETLSDPKQLSELSKALKGSTTAEALYEVDSQGAGVLAVRLIVTNVRAQASVWAP
jgi:hypothetical protein